MLYELPAVEHFDVKTVQEALSGLRQYGDKARVIAGGTDLLGLMKDRIQGPQMKIPEVLINIKAIPELHQVTYDPNAGLRIGAAVTLSQLEYSEVINKKFSVLSQAARQVGTTQLRNMGTIGGNICQRPRCLYFRHPHFPCYKKGGDKCYAAAGEHRHYHSILKHGKCVMACPADMASALVALEGQALINRGEGEKTLPLREFFLGPNSFTETALKSDEILAQLLVPDQKWTHQVFLKHRIRHSSDFSLASVAMVARISDGTCMEIRIVLGGVAPFPYIAFKAEEVIRGKEPSDQVISQAAEASVEEARPLPMNRYKIDLTRALVRRVLTSIQCSAY